MRKVLVIVACIVFCAVIITPVIAVFNTTPHRYITRSYDYVLDGRPGTISLALSTDVYLEYLKKDPYWDINDNTSYFLSYINDPAQQPYIKTLADEIREVTENPDDQVRIATNLVQHIAYNKGNNIRFPYEVLYENRGVCGGKSLLLAALLRELGFKSSVLYFLPVNHMTTGVGCPGPYDFQGSGYCMIETTVISIITDETAIRNTGENDWTIPDIMDVYEGHLLDRPDRDYYDARALIILKSENTEARKAGETLSSKDYERWYRLKAKYDLL